MTTLSMLLDLPNEVKLHIASYIYLPDLGHLSLSCKTWHDILTRRMKEQTDLYINMRSLGCRGDIDYIEYTGPSLTAALKQVLRHPELGTYVEELVISPTRNYPIHLLDWHDEILFSDDDVALMYTSEAAVGRYVSEGDKCWQDIVKGPNDETDPNIHCFGILAFLVPMLPRLRVFSIIDSREALPRSVADFEFLRVVDALATNAERSLLSEPPSYRVPFSHLTRTMLVGMNIHVVYHILAFPSIRLAALDQVDNNGSSWAEEQQSHPDGLPKSRVSMVLMDCTDCSVDDLREFMSHLQGPCVVLQQWEKWTTRNPPDDWLSGVIPYTGAPKDKHLVRLKPSDWRSNREYVELSRPWRKEDDADDWPTFEEFISEYTFLQNPENDFATFSDLVSDESDNGPGDEEMET